LDLNFWILKFLGFGVFGLWGLDFEIFGFEFFKPNKRMSYGQFYSVYRLNEAQSPNPFGVSRLLFTQSGNNINRYNV